MNSALSDSVLKGVVGGQADCCSKGHDWMKQALLIWVQNLSSSDSFVLLLLE